MRMSLNQRPRRAGRRAGASDPFPHGRPRPLRHTKGSEGKRVTHHDCHIMEILKDATAEQHRDAERRRLQADMVRGRLTAAKYSDWLGQMFLLHRALWEEIERKRGECGPLADVVRDDGCHVSNLRADLARLSVSPDGVRPLPSTLRAILAIRHAAEAEPLALLGYNYVLEGSMNGNRFIARAMQPTLSVPAFSYLDPYGEAQRPIWLAYRERMNALELDAGQAERLIAAARDMFAFIASMSDELVEEPVPAVARGTT